MSRTPQALTSIRAPMSLAIAPATTQRAFALNLCLPLQRKKQPRKRDRTTVGAIPCGQYISLRQSPPHPGQPQGIAPTVVRTLFTGRSPSTVGAIPCGQYISLRQSPPTQGNHKGLPLQWYERSSQADLRPL